MSGPWAALGPGLDGRPGAREIRLTESLAQGPTHSLSKAKLSTRTLEPTLGSAELAWLRLHGDGALGRKEGLLDVLGGRATSFSKPHSVEWRLPWATLKQNIGPGSLSFAKGMLRTRVPRRL